MNCVSSDSQDRPELKNCRRAYLCTGPARRRQARRLARMYASLVVAFAKRGIQWLERPSIEQWGAEIRLHFSMLATIVISRPITVPSLSSLLLSTAFVSYCAEQACPALALNVPSWSPQCTRHRPPRVDWLPFAFTFPQAFLSVRAVRVCCIGSRRSQAALPVAGAEGPVEALEGRWVWTPPLAAAVSTAGAFATW